jgi:hypothetical protein
MIWDLLNEHVVLQILLLVMALREEADNDGIFDQGKTRSYLVVAVNGGVICCL